MLRLYMDHNVHGGITKGLRVRGVDVLTAFEDGAHELPDHELLDRASLLGRVLFSQDDDLLKEAVARQRAGRTFGTVIYGHQALPIGSLIADLELIATAGEEIDALGQLIYLPL